MTKIIRTENKVDKEPLLAPFGFKGAYLTELWQSTACLYGTDGVYGTGIGAQSVLWSDADVFVRYGEAEGNRLMHDVTQYALNQAEGCDFETPIDLMEQLADEAYVFAQKLTDHPELRYTFALNALVPVDYAAWALYGRSRGQRFEQLVPEIYRSALSARHDVLGNIPLIPYGMDESGITDLLNDGHFILKIKIGADPEQDGDQDKMLEWDKRRLEQIHDIAQRYTSDYTDSGKICYYLDANGRYETKDRLLNFLEHADRIGALEQTVLFEEPFPEEYEVDVSDCPVRLAADESAHHEADALKRIEMGFGALALKPVAKTMSVSLKMAKIAAEHNIPCFCADLTVNPALADWNKNMAARLAPIPGLKVGVMESNGRQNYRNWEQMKQQHPRAGAPWIEPVQGIFQLDETFYEVDGGALEIGTIDSGKGHEQ